MEPYCQCVLTSQTVAFNYFPIPLLSFILSLSKGHHERTWFNWLIMERPFPHFRTLDLCRTYLL